MKKISIGILAHVDAGKTTLSEGLLYLTGNIKKQGRVDHGDTFLDTELLERERGITIFSKQALFSTGTTSFTLIDTPGHVDFSAETERVLQVLDYAIIVISGTSGLQAHTLTLWSLLRKFSIPTFIFVTKMDIQSCDKPRIINEIKTQLSSNCIDFTQPDNEEIAMCSDEVLEEYAESGTIKDTTISSLIQNCNLYPCYFGSGLKLSGLNEFIEALDKYTIQPKYLATFGARIYKIARDTQGNRLTYMKITGGEISVRTPLSYFDKHGTKISEKISGIRVYNGSKFSTVETMSAGDLIAVTGLSSTFPGQGLGIEKVSTETILEPILSYRVVLPKGCEPLAILPKLNLLQDEDPQLNIMWDEKLNEIRIALMGKVQIEILKNIISDRFGTSVTMDSGRILYRETITNNVEGIGHFEPLRHYAEVHLSLEPLPRGSGLQFSTTCPEDELDRNWQRLILTHLAEKQHIGVLTGSPITDMKITLIAGRAHLKHTEGGDFRQATYRAVRQGLMQARSILLEPYYAFRLEIPTTELGRAINDIRAMNGTFSVNSNQEISTIEGNAPVSSMRDYAPQVAVYTRGRGCLVLKPNGYEECINSQPVIDEIGYIPETDIDNTPDSVFCAHGAGFNVKWSEVSSYMHISTNYGIDYHNYDAPIIRTRNLDIDEKELEAIMEREFGPIKRPMYTKPKSPENNYVQKKSEKKEYLLVDGYNVIFSWDELKSLAQDNLDLARLQLMNTLANYRGYTKCKLVLVFDAYRVSGGSGTKSDYHGINVVYTKQGETADAYIEKLANEIGKNYSVRVVSSDSLIQLSAFGSGVLRETTIEFKNEVDWVLDRIEETMNKMGEKMHNSKLIEVVNADGK